jgi:hypothetical protein
VVSGAGDSPAQARDRILIRMALPSFTHIHSSSRFDRPAATFEAATDNYMKHCSILTVTEIHQNNKAAVLREKGWNYYNARAGKQGADNCGVAWNRDVWACTWQGSRKLHQKGYKRFKAHLPAPYVHACTVVLKHRASGKKLMVSVTHMPAWVDKVGPAPGFKTHGYDWRSRKEAYIESVKTWSVWTEHMIRKHNLDGVLIVSDWNLNMKDRLRGIDVPAREDHRRLPGQAPGHRRRRSGADAQDAELGPSPVQGAAAVRQG